MESPQPNMPESRPLGTGTPMPPSVPSVPPRPPVSSIPPVLPPNVSEPLLTLPQPKRPISKYLIFGGVALVLTAAAAGAYYAYTEIFIKPEEVVRKAIDRTRGQDTVAYQGSLEFSVSAPPDALQSPLQSPEIVPPMGVLPAHQRLSFLLSAHIFAGIFENTFAQENQTPQPLETLTSKIDFSGAQRQTKGQKAGTFGATLTLSAPSSAGTLETTSLKLQAVSTSIKKFFFKFSDLSVPPAVQEEAGVGPETMQLLASAADKWIVFDQEALQKEFGQLSSPGQEELFSSEAFELSPEEETRLMDLLVGSLKLEKLKGEKIDGVRTYHYRMTIEKEGMKVLLREAITIYGGKVGSVALVKSLDDPEFDKALTTIVNGFSGELWIGKRDSLFRKVRMDFNANIEDTQGIGEAQKVVPISIRAAALVQYSGFNQPVEVTEPKGAVPFTDFLAAYLQLVGPSQPRDTPDGKRTRDLEELVYGLVVYHEETNTYPSTSSSLVKINPDVPPCKQLLAMKFPLIQECPQDPDGPPAFYGYKSNGKSFELSAALKEGCNRERVLLYSDIVGEAVYEGNLCIYRYKTQ